MVHWWRKWTSHRTAHTLTVPDVSKGLPSGTGAAPKAHWQATASALGNNLLKSESLGAWYLSLDRPSGRDTCCG